MEIGNDAQPLNCRDVDGRQYQPWPHGGGAEEVANADQCGRTPYGYGHRDDQELECFKLCIRNIGEAAQHDGYIDHGRDCVEADGVCDQE